MKSIFVRNILSAAIVLTASSSFSAENTIDDAAQKIDYSYIQGYSIGQRVSQTGADFDIDVFVAAMKSAMAGEPVKFTKEKIREIVQNEKILKKQKLAQAGKANEEKGKAYLAENKTKPGVTELASGLQYKILKSGTGKSPKDKQITVVHYEGKTIDGTVFDSSIERGKPASFGVNKVIPGFSEALKLMQEGDHWEVSIPGRLAYGHSEAAQGKIGPNETLIFNLQLIEVKDSVSAPALSDVKTQGK